MNQLKDYKAYFIVFAVFCACLFFSPHLYSHERLDGISLKELYEMDKYNWERDNEYLRHLGYMSYDAWLREQDEKVKKCKQVRNCEEMFDRRFHEWIHYMNDTQNCMPKSWYDSDEGRKENN